MDNDNKTNTLDMEYTCHIHASERPDSQKLRTTVWSDNDDETALYVFTTIGALVRRGGDRFDRAHAISDWHQAARFADALDALDETT